MNDQQNTENQNPTDGHPGRPLGFWLRLVDGLLTREVGIALEGEGVSGRDWMLLNVLAGTVDAPGLDERLAGKGKRLRRLEELGWAQEQGDGTWALTDAGREAHARLSEAVHGVRSRVAGAVSSEDYATTLESLEAIARELGWDESQPFPREPRFGGGRFGGPHPFRPEIRYGWGPNRHHGFEPGHPGQRGFDPHHRAWHEDAWSDFGIDDPERPDHDHHPSTGQPHDAHGGFGHGHHGEHGHHGHPHSGHHGHPHGQSHHGHPHGHGHHGHGGHGRRKAERAYERGFAAGFRAAQSADARGAEASDPAA